MQNEKHIHLDIYNSFGLESSFEVKRHYSNVVIQTNCQCCKKTITYEPTTYTLLYCPVKEQKICFGCQDCNHDNHVFTLVDIKDECAILALNESFKEKLEIYVPSMTLTKIFEN